MTIVTAVSLEDKYALESGRIYVTGTQALVRLPMLQRQRDERLGLNTAGFVSGYRGSPLGGLDKEFWKAGKYLDANHVRFQSGVNEDLAATAVWGTQQASLFPDMAMTASSPCGTARALASTAAATCSSTGMPAGPPGMAAS